jgi:hypothetical protein
VTEEQRALRDAFLAEMWKPVPEWHQTKDERADAQARAALLAPVTSVPEVREAS